MTDARKPETSRRDILTSHNTPPEMLFMEGSCIIEIPIWDRASQDLHDILVESESAGSENTARSYRLTSLHGQFLAHIRVVDGSGELLYRFDNNATSPHNLTINLRLERAEAGGSVYVGNFIFIASNGEFRAQFPPEYKIDVKPNDPAMNERRFRLRLLELGTDDDVNIAQVHISKDTNQGSIPVFSVVFSDLSSEGKELKVMVWTDVDHH